MLGRKSFTLCFKQRAFRSLVENDGNISNTAIQLNISRQNLQQWNKDADIINTVSTNNNNDTKSRITRRIRMRVGQYPLLDAKLLKYVKEKTRKEQRVTYRLLQKQASRVFTELYPLIKDKFRSPTGYIIRFLRRNKLSVGRVTGVGQKIPDNAPEICEQFLADIHISPKLRCICKHG